ncbi:MAG TPA: Gfo/Idh/MocA family oxidoreductase [Verrucomicrobiales bacterium]|nr:Gfo/Idh/MocA family oxidoreductase [Verrucomicrobiales bacterium]
MSKRWRVAGINFDHFHMGDLLRLVFDHPEAEIAGICDEQPERMVDAQRNFGLRDDQVFTDCRACLEQTKPDMVILCPAAARHAEWVEKVIEVYPVPILLEKPFAASIEGADRMISVMAAANMPLAVNWPLCWVPAHATAYRLVQEGAVGQLIEVHFYDGNRGPLWHGADKIELEPTPERKVSSWFYKKSEGGGSMLDYLGYGTTLATWYLNKAVPLEVTSVMSGTPGLEVDEHSITVARYEFGLSKFETRWGTLTDPWVTQPQPKCGFVLKGTDGNIASYDYEKTIRVQTRQRPEGYEVPVDVPQPPMRNAVEYFLHCLANNRPVEGPLAVDISRIGQQMVDTAWHSAQEKRTLPLVG